MFNNDTELLFPPRVIPVLRDLRGKTWQTMVDQANSQPANGIDRLAFVLLMIRLGGCTSCHSDSFRAMRGCTQCASQTVRRFRGNDEDLLAQLGDAKKEIERYLNFSEVS